MTLRYRLLVVVLGVALAITLVATGATYYWARHEIDELLDYQLRQQALALRDKAYLLGNVTVVEPDPEQHIVIQLWDRRGVLRYLSHRAVDIERPQHYGYANVSGSGADWRVYATELGPWIVQLAQPFELRRRIAASAAWRMLLPLLAMLPLLAVAMWWIVGRVLAPITEIAASIAGRRENALEPLAEDRLPGEVALMVHALNTLIARLKEVLARQQDFMADAAHELRTPLTAISLQAQLLERAATPGEAGEALAELKRGIERSTHLVERLLMLARLDAASDTDAATPVDLGALVRAALVNARLRAQTQGIRLETRIEDEVRIEGHEAQLQSLIDNLIDNALRYTPAGGSVRVELLPRRHGALFSVTDSGPGIPAADRARVFDRFYRVPGTTAQGSGLGLAIVRRVCELHGARIDIDDTPGGGTVFGVAFPATRADAPPPSRP